MGSTLMMKCFMVAYIICGIICVFEKNYPRALYWTGAGVITFSVLWGMK